MLFVSRYFALSCFFEINLFAKTLLFLSKVMMILETPLSIVWVFPNWSRSVISGSYSPIFNDAENATEIDSSIVIKIFI